MKSTLSILFLLCSTIHSATCQTIPLPEHPRPDFERSQWQNLNGNWQFQFDSLNLGIAGKWSEGTTAFNQSIVVPFPWGSPLSGVKDKADVAWYQRDITIPTDWANKRTFITFGASDWETSVWLDGKLLGKHQGGYTPFSFELTPYVNYGRTQRLVVRVDDIRRDFTLYGKQGYGNARGLWQTVYVEARGKKFLDAIQFAPDIDHEQVTVTLYTHEAPESETPVSIVVIDPESRAAHSLTFAMPQGLKTDSNSFTMAMPKQHLWSLEDPFLYTAEVRLGDDVVKTYFGMRKISIMNLPGTDFPYVALNNKPVYLQLTLDQSYHPDGYYTFPDDNFMREEIMRTKSIGLTGIRTHVKVEVPRKLYWADKLGVLVMADLPNSWGEPDARMREEAQRTFREMVKRDFNHPSIFSWILFNETWGLRTAVVSDGKKQNKYLPITQQWVASMYRLAKALDPTRLVEDNSICCGAGHTQTDINSFHDYLPGWEWDKHLKMLTDSSYAGSSFQFEKGFHQGNQPKINSECGNVWGYDGSTGDVDWSWDYHRMMNTFRQYPEVAGWLYTEHHDVINEWNGYWRFDRTKKFTGVEELMPGMTIGDWHAPVYISTGNEICRSVAGGETLRIPLYLSSMTGADFGKQLKLTWQLQHTNILGETALASQGSIPVDYRPYLQQSLEPLTVTAPVSSGLSTLRFQLQDSKGNVLHHNFMNLEVKGANSISGTQVISVPASDFSNAQWSLKQWTVMDGLKVCGAGKGFFEYTFKLAKPSHRATEAYFLIELSAKELFVKDRDKKENAEGDFMLGAKVAPSANPNAYPMTDETLFPSALSVSLNGEQTFETTLPDDPADHRGILSWHHQRTDRKLREAGSYGYLIKIPVTKEQLAKAISKGEMVVRLSATGDGGIAVYGKSFGRYPLDPTLVLKY